MTGANRDEKCSRILRVLPDYSPSSHGLQGLPIVSAVLWWNSKKTIAKDKDNSKDKKKDYSPPSHGLQGLPIVSVSWWLVIQRRWEKDNCRSEDKDNSKDKKKTNLNSSNRLQSLPSLSVVTKTKKNVTTRITNQKTNISSHWLQDYEFTRKDEDDWKNNGNTITNRKTSTKIQMLIDCTAILSSDRHIFVSTSLPWAKFKGQFRGNSFLFIFTPSDISTALQNLSAQRTIQMDTGRLLAQSLIHYTTGRSLHQVMILP